MNGQRSGDEAETRIETTGRQRVDDAVRALPDPAKDVRGYGRDQPSGPERSGVEEPSTKAPTGTANARAILANCTTLMWSDPRSTGQTGAAGQHQGLEGGARTGRHRTLPLAGPAAHLG